jgi:subtilisin
VGVAVVDTGLDFAHQDLQPLGAACFTAFTSCEDDNGHGTHVGGIIAARDNTIDVIGVAPDAVLYAVKALDGSGNGSDSTVMAGLEWVLDNGNAVFPPIRVVNMSLGRAGSLDDNPALRALVKKLHDPASAECADCLGITVVVSAGNDANREVSQMVPATYPEVMAVASTTAFDGSNSCRFFSGVIRQDTAAYFTTDGAFDAGSRIGVTVSAPGADKENVSKGCFVSSVGILSTRLGGGTTRLSGTSMAAPHVAGVVALMWEKWSAIASSLDPEEARSIIRSTAVTAGSAPLDSPTGNYSFDGEREGIVSATATLQ